MGIFSADSQKQWAKLGVRAGIGAILLGILAATLLYPAWLSLDRSKTHLDSVQRELAEQQALLPLRAGFLAAKKKLPEVDLVIPELKPLPRMEVFSVRDRLTDAVQSAGMDPLEVNLNALDVTPGTEAVVVDVIASGRTESIRDLYVVLASLPYIKEVRKVEVRAVQGGVEVYMGLLVAIAKAGEVSG